MTIKEITDTIEAAAPIALQEDYDNSGLQIGNAALECSGALLCVDVTPQRVKEAVDEGCNLIISHHPLLFNGLKKITGRSLVEQTVAEAISAGVAVYSSHTAIDNASYGVSTEMAKRLGIDNASVLAPQTDRLMKLSVFVPLSHSDDVRIALFEAGAGKLGNYDSCSYTVKGEGSFRALDGAKPYVGTHREIHVEPEERIEVLLPSWLMHSVEEALLEVHPYEEPAYEFVNIANLSRHSGAGSVGNLPYALSPSELIDKVKTTFGCPTARCSQYPADALIRRVAMCGGSGASLIKRAIASGATAYITSDVRYHDFVDYQNRILIIDIGHYESEQFTKDIFYRLISEKFPNFAVRFSESETNPIKYM